MFNSKIFFKIEFSIYETKQNMKFNTDIKKLNEINNTFFNNKRSK